MVHFTLLLNKVRSFSVKEMFFVSVLFQKSIRLDSGAPLLLKSISYHLNRLKKLFAGAQEPFKWWRTLRGTFSWNLKKIFRTSIFSSTSEGLLLNTSKTRSSLLWSFIFSISHFSSLKAECTEVAVCSCFKIGVLKNFAIFTGKHLCWSIQPSGLQLY